MQNRKIDSNEGVIQSKLKIRFLPFHSIGKKRGVLLAIKVDAIFVLEEEIQKNNIWIALYEGKLSQKGEYQALIGPEILERGKKKDGFTADFKRTS